MFFLTDKDQFNSLITLQTPHYPAILSDYSIQEIYERNITKLKNIFFFLKNKNNIIQVFFFWHFHLVFRPFLWLAVFVIVLFVLIYVLSQRMYWTKTKKCGKVLWCRVLMACTVQLIINVVYGTLYNIKKYYLIHKNKF